MFNRAILPRLSVMPTLLQLIEATSVVHSPAEVGAVEAWIKALMAQTRAMDGEVSRSRDTIEVSHVW
jgi:hypothetical protein